MTPEAPSGVESEGLTEAHPVEQPESLPEPSSGPQPEAEPTLELVQAAEPSAEAPFIEAEAGPATSSDPAFGSDITL